MILALLLLTIPPGGAPAIQDVDDPITADFAQTGEALRLLLDASSTSLPPDGTCSVGRKEHPTVADHLAGTLAGMDAGENAIVGMCEDGACRVRISHRGGDEDLSRWEYRFRIARGRMVAGSLQCLGG